MILCFSGTGNSLFLAKELSSLCGEEVFSINAGLKDGIVPSISESEKLIFVVPTYAWRIPNIVKDWIEKTEFGLNHKAWFVMSCGGEIGNAAKYNKELADVKGFEYMGSIGVKLPDNYIIMFKDESQEVAEATLSKAKDFIPSVAKRINENKAFDAPRRNLYDRAMSSLVNPSFYKNVKADLFTASDACTSCGLCEKKCPLNNIKMVDGKPKWGNTCTHCMACISYCSPKAIEYGKKTVGKRRYTFEGYFK